MLAEPTGLGWSIIRIRRCAQDGPVFREPWEAQAFAILFTGAWPAGLRETMVKVNRWFVQVDAYGLLLRDEFPPLGL